MQMKTKVDIVITTASVALLGYFAGALWWEMRRK